MELGTAARAAPSDELESWVAAQAQRSITAMELAISATGLARRRENFDQTIVPSAGSVLASTTIGDWNPEPDYFFHWLRDSAIVMRTVVGLMQDATSSAEQLRWQTHFENFVPFSLGLTGSARYDPNYRKSTSPEFHEFLRDEGELHALSGDKLLGEPRFNPDGTIDIMRWSRPQYDGPALRALACLDFLAAGGRHSDGLDELLTLDLDFTRRHAGKRCFGPWEEKSAHHYYVALVQLGALVHGRRLTGTAAVDAEQMLYAQLERHWSEWNNVFVAAVPSEPGDDADDALDASFLLGVLDADLPGGPHSIEDPRVHATQKAIEDMFARELPINRARLAGCAPALGRYRADQYFGGGAWFSTTLAAAALYYRRANRAGEDRAALIKRGDDFMATVRNLTPPDGALPEQVDRETGQATSARHLTWSDAAFVNAARSRRLLKI